MVDCTVSDWSSAVRAPTDAAELPHGGRDLTAEALHSHAVSVSWGGSFKQA